MTVHSSGSREFQVGELIRMALVDARVIGMHELVDTARMQFGRDKLDLILDRMPANAPTVRQSRLDAVTLVANTQDYTLASDVIGVPGPVFYLDVTEDLVTPDVRKELDQVGMPTWLEKAQGYTGGPAEPTLAWIEMGKAPPVLHVWPPPTDGGTVQVRVTRLLMDAGPDGTNTLDVERLWVPYLQKALAGELCLQRSYNDAMILKAEAKTLLEECNRVDGDAPTGRFVFPANNRWRKL